MRIRIKNDIEFKWAITREDGKKANLMDNESFDLRIVNNTTREYFSPIYSIGEDDVVTFQYPAPEQEKTGVYTLFLCFTQLDDSVTGGIATYTIDAKSYFYLVPSSSMEADTEPNESSFISANLATTLHTYIGGGQIEPTTTDYNTLSNKPSIKGIILEGDKTPADLNLQEAGDYVVAEQGKGLSSNDFTNEDKSKLDGLANYDDTNVTSSINGINETLAQKVDKVVGKVLSSNDFTNEEKQLLASISERLVEAETELAKIPIFEIVTN